MKKLEGKDLYRRLQESRNAKKALAAALQREASLKQRVSELETIVAAQTEVIAARTKQIETLTMRVEELTRMVFGKGKRKDPPEDGGSGSSNDEPKKREASSYFRTLPKMEEVTSESLSPISVCPDCSSLLTSKKIHVLYTEDILPVGTPLKTIHKETVESGYCKKCKARKVPSDIRGANVRLGSNIKIMIVYFTTVMRLSYEQVRAVSRDIYGLELSDGEIRNALEEHSNRILHEYKTIEKRLLKQDCHFDETTYKTLKGARGNYAWIQTAVNSTDTLFVFGESRGIGVIKKLYGKSRRAGITDDYPAYDNIFEDHELCWAHPRRKLRDLAKSSSLFGAAKDCAQESFRAFQSLYTDLRNGIWENYSERFDEITVIHPDDPAKLKIYKNTLKERKEFYFTFIRFPGMPMDNNQAERRLRHLVLKRKTSFSFKTKAAADAMAKLFSVVLTHWWKDPRNFLKNYAAFVA